MVIHSATSPASDTVAGIRLVLTDCDGVLTDGGVYYSARGEELKRFSMRDGMGIERLRMLAQIPVGILTKESSAIVAARARKLGITQLHAGVTDKLSAARDVAERSGLSLSQVAYIGDDVNDLELLAAAGFSACPSDAEPVVRRTVHAVCARAGGHGAFREFAEVIIEAHRAHAACPPDRPAPRSPRSTHALLATPTEDH